MSVFSSRQTLEDLLNDAYDKAAKKQKVEERERREHDVPTRSAFLSSTEEEKEEQERNGAEMAQVLYDLAFDGGEIQRVGGEFWFGRNPDHANSKTIADPLVSLNHCCLTRGGKALVLRDVSTNGTWVNSTERVWKGSKVLNWGDRVTIECENEVLCYCQDVCVRACVRAVVRACCSGK